MTTKQAEGINLYFGDLQKSGLLDQSKDSSAGSLKYILLQNDQLHQQVEESKDKCRELEETVDELESSNDSLEKTRKCLQGYIKNEHQIGLWYKELHLIDMELEQMLRRNLMVVWIVVFLMSAVGLWYLNTALILGAGSYLYLTGYQRYKTGQAKKQELLKKLAETEQANSYLDDLIDNM